VILDWRYGAHGYKPRRCLGTGFIALWKGGETVAAAAAYYPPQFSVARLNVGTLDLERVHVGTLDVARKHVKTLEIDRG
jgi:hypothetical protein